MCGLQEGPKDSIARDARGLPSDEPDSGNAPRPAQARNFSLSSSSFLVRIPARHARGDTAFEAAWTSRNISRADPLRNP